MTGGLARWQRRVKDLAGAGLLLAVPTRRQSLVHGWPDSEGNSLAMLHFLARNTPEPVVWLVSGPPSGPLVDRVVSELPGVRVRPQSSVRGFWAYLRSDLVFFTHPLYAASAPRRGRLFVNLWHGDGPKDLGVAAARVPGSSVVVAGTRLWGRYKSGYFGVPESDVLVVGNPRNDLLGQPPPDDRLARLGLDPTRPIVIWMPTFREWSGSGSAWSDTRRLSEVFDLAELAALFRDLRARIGMQVIVKPHPADSERFGSAGLELVTDADLAAAGVGLYELLGRADALITDYSSVWVDYLVTGRPVAMLCPDLAAYEAGRGFNVDDLERYLPSRVMSTTAELGTFLKSTPIGGPEAERKRQDAVEAIGAEVRPGACARLWTEVERRRPAARQRGIAPSSSGARTAS